MSHDPIRSTRQRRLIITLVWVAAFVFVACTAAPGASAPISSAPISSAPVTATTSTAPVATAPSTRFDGKVDVGGGKSLAARCVGTGSPTILLEGGGTRAGMEAWDPSFVDTLAEHTTVCLYSHRGATGSSAATEPLRWGAILADADAVLAAMKTQAGIEGPYVFVGWSFGGEVALGEAVENLTRTAGLVILDTDFPIDFMVNCEASGRTKPDCKTEFESDLEAKAIEADLVKTIRPLPGIPIAIVSAVQPDPDCTISPGASAVTASIQGMVISASDCATLMQRIANVGLTQWRTLGSQVTQTRVDATHGGLIQLAGPQIVDVIVGVLAQAP